MKNFSYCESTRIVFRPLFLEKNVKNYFKEKFKTTSEKIYSQKKFNKISKGRALSYPAEQCAR